MEPVDSLALVSQTIAGKYRIDALLGEGGAGIVYAATNTLLSMPVAIKCIKPQEGGTRHDIDSFLREAQLLFSLSHPGIVRIYDVGEIQVPQGSLLYLVLERVQGVSLETEIARRRDEKLPWSPVEVQRIFAAIVAAVAHAHACRVIHRDLKPSNVMLTETGALKVLDFGTARSGDEATKLTAHFTPRYAAPEQWDPSRGPRGTWTDVYALGVLLYELATLEKAAKGTDLPTIIASVFNQARPRLSALRVDCSALEPLLARCLALVPGERFVDAGALLAALQADGPTGVGQAGAVARAATGPAGGDAPNRALDALKATQVTAEGALMLAALTRGSEPPPARAAASTQFMPMRSAADAALRATAPLTTSPAAGTRAAQARTQSLAPSALRPDPKLLAQSMQSARVAQPLPQPLEPQGSQTAPTFPTFGLAPARPTRKSVVPYLLAGVLLVLSAVLAWRLLH